MPTYKYKNFSYKTKISIGEKTEVLSGDDSIEVPDKKRKIFDDNPDFELIDGSVKITEKSLYDMIESMGWRNFQKYAKDRWKTTDTSKNELVREILEKIGGGE